MADHVEPQALSVWRLYMEQAIELGLWAPPDGMTVDETLSAAARGGRAEFKKETVGWAEQAATNALRIFDELAVAGVPVGVTHRPGLIVDVGERE